MIARMCVALFLMLLAVVPSVAANSYPSKPVRIVLPFPPGGPSDVFVRLLAERLQTSLGQPFIVDYRPGATGIIGSTHVANAAADGYTLLFAPNSSHVIAPLLRSPHPYDPLQNFAPISQILTFPFYLIVNNDLPAKSVSDLVTLAKEQPGKLNFPSVGIGSGNHLINEIFRSTAGIKTVHVPYPGVAAMQKALMAGEVHYMFDSIGPSKPLVDAGRMRGLAITGKNRSPLLPETPTLEKSGFPGFDQVIWFGVFAHSSPRASLRIGRFLPRCLSLAELA
jgi:tripartite-type tricarboxylate transporter receptor subunit TctC